MGIGVRINVLGQRAEVYLLNVCDARQTNGVIPAFQVQLQAARPFPGARNAMSAVIEVDLVSAILAVVGDHVDLLVVAGVRIAGVAVGGRVVTRVVVVKHELVAALAAGKDVVAGAADKDVVAVAAIQLVVAAEAPERIGASIALDDVAAGITFQRVV